MDPWNKELMQENLFFFFQNKSEILLIKFGVSGFVSFDKYAVEYLYTVWVKCILSDLRGALIQHWKLVASLLQESAVAGTWLGQMCSDSLLS